MFQAMLCCDSACHAAIRRSRLLVDGSCRPKNPFAGEQRTSSYDAAEQGRRASRHSLYSVLGVSPKATNGEIKAAYYRLSKTFHPDRNKDNEDSVRRFREITEAYDVLGSHGTRRRYDRGLLTVDGSGVVHDAGESHDKDEEVANEGFQRGSSASSQWRRSTKYDATRRSPVVGRRSAIYDFDEWTKNHYGATLNRDFDAKRAAEIHRQRMETHKTGWKAEIAALVLFFMVLITLMSLKDWHDVPSHDKRTITANRAKVEHAETEQTRPSL